MLLGINLTISLMFLRSHISPSYLFLVLIDHFIYDVNIAIRIQQRQRNSKLLKLGERMCWEEAPRPSVVILFFFKETIKSAILSCPGPLKNLSSNDEKF